MEEQIEWLWTDLLAVIHTVEMFQLLTLKPDLRQHATRVDHEGTSSVILNPKDLKLLFIW